MNITMYRASVPSFIRMLRNLSNALDRASQYAASKGIDSRTLVRSRLYPEMPPLANQVQCATHTAKECAARLSVQEVPDFPRTEITFEELEDRIDRTCRYLEAFRPQQFNGSEKRTVTHAVGGSMRLYTGVDFLFDFVIPTFHFHLITTYAILQNRGLRIDQYRDFLGDQ